MSSDNSNNLLLLPHKKRQDAAKISEISSSYFTCELCGEEIKSQLLFFNHLKLHYEPPMPSNLLNVDHGEFSSDDSDEILKGIDEVVQQQICSVQSDAEEVDGVEKNPKPQEEQVEDALIAFAYNCNEGSNNMKTSMEFVEFYQQRKADDCCTSSVSSDFEEIFANNMTKNPDIIERLESFIKEDEAGDVSAAVDNPNSNEDDDHFETIFDQNNHPEENGTIVLNYIGNNYTVSSSCVQTQETHRNMHMENGDNFANMDHQEITNQVQISADIAVGKSPSIADGGHCETKGNLKLIPCTLCDRNFKSKNAWKYHQLTHSRNKADSRQFACQFCDKAFLTNSARKVHLRVHEDERPYPCTLCEKRFKQRTDLNYHKSSIHTATRDYIFQCDYCGKKFARKYSLDVHRRIHTKEKNFECDLCTKRFSTSSYLIAHRRKHSNDRPHNCSICSKAFKSKMDMLRHVRNQHSNKRRRS